jgi:hypothetical protein
MKRVLLGCLMSVLMLGSISAQNYESTWESLDKRPTPAGSATPSSASLFIGVLTPFPLMLRYCLENWPTLSGTGTR